jgi:DNA-binding transcriptional MocR family regulator
VTSGNGRSAATWPVRDRTLAVRVIIPLTRGVPPVSAFPVAELGECAATALRDSAAVLLQYGRSPGYAPLREWLGQHYGVAPDQVLIANGALEIFSFITQACLAPGARVFVESPSYDRSITLLRRTGADVIGIPLEDGGLDLAALERRVREKPPALVYVISDFQNPTGVSTSLEKRVTLAELARTHDFWIVEDAAYRALRYRGEDIPTLWSLAPDRVLHVSSFSKVLAPGLRLGYAVGPASTIALLARWAIDSYIGPVLPTQGIVYEYCRRGWLAANIARLRHLYRPRLEATLSALRQHLPRAIWTRPDGGFFVGITLPSECTMSTLRDRAEHAGLQITDGRAFFPTPEDGEHFLRFPFCSLTPEEIDEAAARLGRLI